MTKDNSEQNTAVDTSSKAGTTSPKDVFLQLLAIITLYVSAITFTVLLFQYINLAFPDPLESFRSTEGIRNSIRFAIATLIVVFPVYVGTMWYLRKGYDKNPSKRDLRIRKWLIYFTMFVVALIIIGDFVSLVFNLLGGELTARFVLKALAIFFVTGSIFGYYFADIRRYRTE